MKLVWNEPPEWRVYDCQTYAIYLAEILFPDEVPFMKHMIKELDKIGASPTETAYALIRKLEDCLPKGDKI